MTSIDFEEDTVAPVPKRLRVISIPLAKPVKVPGAVLVHDNFHTGIQSVEPYHVRVDNAFFHFDTREEAWAFWAHVQNAGGVAKAKRRKEKLKQKKKEAEQESKSDKAASAEQ